MTTVGIYLVVNVYVEIRLRLCMTTVGGIIIVLTVRESMTKKEKRLLIKKYLKQAVYTVIVFFAGVSFCYIASMGKMSMYELKQAEIRLELQQVKAIIDSAVSFSLYYEEIISTNIANPLDNP